MKLQALAKTTKVVALFFGSIVAVGCSVLHAPTPTGAAGISATALPKQTRQSTAVPIPTDLAFAAPLVHTLNEAGLDVLSVQSSTFMSMFQSTNKAAWIKTDNGAVDVVFFGTPEEANRIRITESPNAPAGRFVYIVQVPPPTLLHSQTIDAGFPLYHIVGHGMFMETSSQELDEVLRHAFSER